MKKQRKCKKCGQYGHQARTCGRSPKGKPSASRQKEKDWKMQALASIAGTLESSQPAPSDQGETQSDSDSKMEGEDSSLPPVSIPPLRPEESGTGSTSESQTEETNQSPSFGPDASAQGASKESEASPGSGGGQSKKKSEPPGKEKIVEMGANMWCAGLAIGSEWLRSKGAIGIPDALIAVNHMAVTIVLDEWLKDGAIIPAEVAAYVCLGTASFGGVQGYFVWRNQAKNGAKAPPPMNKGNVIDAEFTDATGSSGNPVNGQPTGAKQEYAPDERIKRPITRGEYT